MRSLSQILGSRGRLVAAAILTLIVAASGLWLLLGSRGQDPDVSPFDGRASSDQPVLQGRERGVAGSAADSDGPSSNASDPTGEDRVPFIPGVPSKVGFRVQVFDIATRVPLSGVDVEVSLVSGGPGSTLLARGVTDERGRVDVGPFQVPQLPRRALQGHQLVVRLRSRSGVDTHRLDTLPLQAAAAKRAQGGGDEGDSVLWVRQRFPHHGGFRVLGRVLSSDGGPPTLAHVRVEEEGDWVRCEADGSFAIEVEEIGECALVAAASAPGVAEVRSRKIVEVKQDMDPVTIQVNGMERITGLVVSPEGEPIPDVQVILAPEGQAVSSSASPRDIPRELRAPAVLGVHSASDGGFSFAIPDSPGSFWIWWRGDDGVMRRHPDAVRTGERDVRVLCERHRVMVELREVGTDVLLDGHIEVLEVDGRPATRSPFQVVESFWRGTESGISGPPGTRLLIRASARGYQPETAVVEVPGDSWRATHVLSLAPSRSDGVILVSCRDDQGARLSGVPLQLSADGSREALPAIVTWRGNTARLEGFAPGKLEISTRSPLGVPSSARWHLYRSASQLVAVSPESAAKVELEIERAGALRLRITPAARGTGGVEIRALRDGVILPVRWFAGTGASLETWKTGSALEGVTTLTSGALPRGDYELRVGRGGGGPLKTLSVRVLPGEISEERVELDR